MLETSVHRSIRELRAESWNRLFPGQLETFDYLAAVEDSRFEGFRLRYVVAWDAGQMVAAVPAFLTEYALDTTLTGAGKRLLAGIRERLPRALTLQLACLGSPCTETLPLGFDAGLEPAQRAAALQSLLKAFERHAVEERAGLLALKDLAQCDDDECESVLRQSGYRSIGGLPVAYLPLACDSIDAYLAGLGSGTRRDMRRKLRSLQQVRVQVTTDVEAVLPRIMELYRGTRSRAQMQFEELTPAYFTGVLAKVPGHAFCVLYWVGDELLAVNLLLQDATTLLDKYFCMDPQRGRELNLYFISWFTNIRLCLERGLTVYQSGQAGYENKLRLGCRLIRTSMWFRHRNPLVQAVLRLVAPLLAADPVAEVAA